MRENGAAAGEAPAQADPAAGTAPGVEVEDVSMVLTGERRVQALSRVSFTIPRTHFCCIIGASGCGKSTLLSLLAGFLKPTSGRLRMAGKDVSAKDLRRAVVFQEYALFPWRTAVGNVRMGLESRGVKEDQDAVAREYLGLVGLSEFADVYPHQLSGGMRQRVAIARALACEPEFLLMDEPLGALDALTRDRLQVLVSDLWQRFGQTVVYVTHNVSEAVYLGNDIVVMTPQPGRVKEIVHVGLPFPRRPTDPAFVELLAHVTSLVTGTGKE